MSMPTEQDLQAMSPHVIYEVEEFRRSREALRTLPKTSPEWNRTLESVLLHFRNLRAFFFEDGIKKGDDVFARHYLGGTNWKPEKREVFDKTKKDIDKRLAHLTLERLEPSPGYNVDQMSVAIENLVKDFKGALAEPGKSWFSRLDPMSVIDVFGAANHGTETWC